MNQVDQQIASIVQEPAAPYVLRKVRDGLPFEEFCLLRAALRISDEKLACLLGMSRATLHRRKHAGQLDRAESDRLVRYARVFHMAVELFRSEEAAARWLGAPALAFDGEAPLDYADTEVGAREVEALIGRMAHGVFT